MEQKTLKALSLCPLFRGISLGQLEATIDSVGYKILKFDKKDIYILAGMPYRHADIVIEGEMVARMVSLSGKSVEVSRLKQGDIVAPAFIFAKDNLMPVSVETETATVILRMSIAGFERLIDTDPVLRHNFIQALSDIDVSHQENAHSQSFHRAREGVLFH